jgi:hypothetical protein
MIGESAMLHRFSLLLGTAAALTIAAPVFAQDDEDSAFLSHEHRMTRGLNRAQLEYGVMPRPNPHWRWYWDPDYGRWVWRRSHYAPVLYGEPPNSAHPRSSEASAPKTIPTSQKKTSASEAVSHKAASHVERRTAADNNKPLTPAEIRAAIPLRQVNDPKAVLSKAKVRSLWGDLTGHVESVQMDGTALSGIEADVGSTFGEKQRIVKLDPGRLKFVKSRGVVVTTMSKPDVEKLPKVNNS